MIICSSISVVEITKSDEAYLPIANKSKECDHLSRLSGAARPLFIS
jgi:hypothetical protein